MAEHTPISIDIDSNTQDNDSTLSNETESHRSTVVTPHKKDKTFLPSCNTTTFQKIPKTPPNKEKSKK